MHHNLLLILGLLFVVFMLVMLANKIKVAYPIFLVIAGLGISFIPGVPPIELDPDLIFTIFLPPLLYEAAWYTSWKDFWKWKRSIALLAFGLVFFTSLIVAYGASYFIPGFTLALGFLLGGIVSPPDAVAAATVMKGIKVPKRIITILEGESLVNDASSLIVFRFALAAVLTGTFSMQVAVGDFFLAAGMGIVIGLVIANIIYVIHRFLPTTPAIDAALTVMTPYIAFLAAEQFHFSGVMAVVTAGLFISYRANEVFSSGATKVNMLGVWTTMIFVMNTLVFILIGLDLPFILKNLGDYSIWDGLKYGLIISAITIGVRFIWVYPAAFLPRYLSKKIRTTESSPGWRGVLVTSWAGMRGVVSLATALSIPIYLSDGTAFPMRNLIIFITFVVIFITLVVQGLSLPWIIKKIGLKEIDPVIAPEEEQAQIYLRLKKLAHDRLQIQHKNTIANNELVAALANNTGNDLAQLEEKLNSFSCVETDKRKMHTYRNVLNEIYHLQRKELHRIRKEKTFSDEALRQVELRLDLDETKFAGAGH